VFLRVRADGLVEHLECPPVALGADD